MSTSRKKNAAYQGHQDKPTTPSTNVIRNPIPDGQRCLVNEDRIRQMERSEREAMEAKAKQISGIYENYVQTALIRVGRNVSHHFAQSTPLHKPPPRTFPRTTEHVVLPRLNNVMGVDKANGQDKDLCLESFRLKGSLSSSMLRIPVPPRSSSPFKKEKKKKKKKGRLEVEALNVQSDINNDITPIDLFEKSKNMQVHLNQEAWKVVKELEATGRRYINPVNSTGERTTSSLGTLSSVDMETPEELRCYLEFGTPDEPRNPTPIPSPPPTKPTSKLLQTPKFFRTARAASSSDKKVASEPTSHIVEIKDQARLQPLDNPEQALDKTLKLLSSDSVDWEKKIEGLTSLRSMAQNHKELLMPRLHDVCLAVIDEVKNLRSAVSRAAMVTLGDMYVHLQRAMDCEVEVTGRVLLHLASYANAFIRQSANTALRHMVQSCSPTRVLKALLAGGLSHRNAAVRGSAAEHLKSLVEVMGAAHILSGKKDLTKHFLIAVSKLAVDPAQDVRHHGLSILKNLATHGSFAKMWQKSTQKKEQDSLRDVILKLNLKARK